MKVTLEDNVILELGLIEPSKGMQPPDIHSFAVCSIAVSLKRIADRLDSAHDTYTNAQARRERGMPA